MELYYSGVGRGGGKPHKDKKKLLKNHFRLGDLRSYSQVKDKFP